MAIISHSRLVKEMIYSHSQYVSQRIENERNKLTYLSTLAYIQDSLLFYSFTSFCSLRNHFNRFKENTYLLTANLSKKDKEYFDLAVEHCSDIIESIERRFGVIDPEDTGIA